MTTSPISSWRETTAAGRNNQQEPWKGVAVDLTSPAHSRGAETAIATHTPVIPAAKPQSRATTGSRAAGVTLDGGDSEGNLFGIEC